MVQVLPNILLDPKSSHIFYSLHVSVRLACSSMFSPLKVKSFSLIQIECLRTEGVRWFVILGYINKIDVTCWSCRNQDADEQVVCFGLY